MMTKFNYKGGIRMINLKRMDKAYAEVYLFLEILGDEYKNKIPSKIYEVIRDFRDQNYNPDIKDGKSLSKEALVLISAFNLQYWCENPNEKQELKNIYVENAKKEKERLEAKVDYDTIFNRNKKDIEEVPKEENQEVALVSQKESFFSKIKSFFAKLFHRE